MTKDLDSVLLSGWLRFIRNRAHLVDLGQASAHKSSLKGCLEESIKLNAMPRAQSDKLNKALSKSLLF